LTDVSNNKHDISSANLLDTFGETMSEKRQECNRAAAISIARATLLIGGLVAALLLRYWLI